MKGRGLSIGRKITFFFLITWGILCIFAFCDGRGLGSTPRASFLLDFTVYARFFIAMPLLFMAEATVGVQLRKTAQRFFQRGFVYEEDFPAVENAIRRVERRCQAWLPELLIAMIAFVGGSQLSLEAFTRGTEEVTWHSLTLGNGRALSLAGLWYHCVALPLFQFFSYRWLWRIIIWAGFLRDLARCKWRLTATHPDRAGGIAFFGGAHTAFAMLVSGLSSVLVAHITFRVHFEGVPIESFQVFFVVYIMIAECLCLWPLVFLVPQLARTRWAGLRQYSIMSDAYSRAFEQKWMANHTPQAQGAPLLGSADIQALADLGLCFQMIRKMKFFPVTRWQLLYIAFMAILPALPLILWAIPAKRMIGATIGALLRV